MSSLPTDIWQEIVGFCPQKLMFREVCKQLRDELEYVISLLNLPIKPKITFPENFRIMGLRPNLYTKDLRLLGIDLGNIISLDCGLVCSLEDKDLAMLPSLKILNCGCNTNFTDAGLMHLLNLVSLHCGINTKLSNEGLMHLTKLESLECGININFTDVGLMYLPKLVKLDCGWNIKISNEGISHLKLLEKLVIPNYASIITYYNKDEFPFMMVGNSSCSTRVFQRVL